MDFIGDSIRQACARIYVRRAHVANKPCTFSAPIAHCCNDIRRQRQSNGYLSGADIEIEIPSPVICRAECVTLSRLGFRAS